MLRMCFKMFLLKNACNLSYIIVAERNLQYYLFCVKLCFPINQSYTVDSHCLEFGWLEFPVESNFYQSPEHRCV
jgi:hypothetical protein